MAINRIHKTLRRSNSDRWTYPTANAITDWWELDGTLIAVMLIATGGTFTASRWNVRNDGSTIFSGDDRPSLSSSVLTAEKTGLNVTVEKGKKWSLDLETISGGYVSDPLAIMLFVDDHFNDQKEVIYTTASLANGASENAAPTLTKMGIMTGIETDRPARIRVYATAAERTADESREVGTDPEDGQGVFLDVVTTSEKLAINLSPEAPFSNMESSRSADIPVRITNMGTTGTVQVKFKFNKIEE